LCAPPLLNFCVFPRKTSFTRYDTHNTRCEFIVDSGNDPPCARDCGTSREAIPYPFSFTFFVPPSSYPAALPEALPTGFIDPYSTWPDSRQNFPRVQSPIHILPSGCPPLVSPTHYHKRPSLPKQPRPPARRGRYHQSASQN
jgi:hypothetical protein